MSQEIADTLTEMENCFRLLLPDPFDFAVHDTELEPNKEMSANEDRPASPWSSQMEVNQSYLECVDDEQPCCSKDILSQCVRTNKELDEKQEKPEQKDLDGGTWSEVRSGVPALDDDDDYETFVRNHGLVSHKYTLDIEISTGTWKYLLLLAGGSLSLKYFVVVRFLNVGVPRHHFDLELLGSTLISFGVLSYF